MRLVFFLGLNLYQKLKTLIIAVHRSLSFLFRLQELVLLKNNIGRLRITDFNTSKCIDTLNMAYNKLRNENMDDGTLRKLANLTTLDVTENELTAIPSLPM